MLESRGVTRKVEVACIVVALAIWIGGLVYGFQTMLGPGSRASKPGAYTPTTIQFHGYDEDTYDGYDAYGYEYDGSRNTADDRQALAETPPSKSTQQ